MYSRRTFDSELFLDILEVVSLLCAELRARWSERHGDAIK